MEIYLQCHLETTNASLPGSLLRYGRNVFSYRAGESLADYMFILITRQARPTINSSPQGRLTG
jgi:hypothetical protein